MLTLLGCQTFSLDPFEVGITLPYSGICHFKDVVTEEVSEFPPDQCETIKKKSLIITTDALKAIIGNLQKNCAYQQCVELKGKLDNLLLTVDQGLQDVP